MVSSILYLRTITRESQNTEEMVHLKQIQGGVNVSFRPMSRLYYLCLLAHQSSEVLKFYKHVTTPFATIIQSDGCDLSEAHAHLSAIAPVLST
jgi:hypothetical protein